jgi:ADP-ribose pyrophosphatase
VRRLFDFEWFKIRWMPGYGWIVDRTPAVVVVPISSDDRVWMLRIERIPTRRISWEVPGGAVDGDESLLQAALRELEEESGLTVRGRSRLLPTPLELAPGMGTFPHHIVVASDVGPRGRHPVPQREESVLAVRKFDRSQVKRMLRRGAISVQATIAALAVSGWLDESLPRKGRR